jgi:endosialidase-like protein
MLKLIIGIGFGVLLFSSSAMALCTSYPNTLTNGTTADATQVMANFNCAALTSGATLSGVSLTGTTSLPGPGIITSGGTMGLGTSTPGAMLDVYGGEIKTRTNDGPPWLGSGIALGVVGTNMPYVGFRVSDQSQRFQVNVAAVNTSSERLTFSGDCGGACGMTEYLSINKSGAIGIDKTAPAYTLDVNGTAYATGAAGALSDIRHKRDVATLRDGALEEVMRLRPVTFFWREPKDAGMQGQQFGFIAQEIEKVVPTVVLTQDNAEKTKGLKYNELIALLTKAMQEQQDQIKALKTEEALQIRALKAANDNQRSEIRLLRSQIVSPGNKARIQTAAR